MLKSKLRWLNLMANEAGAEGAAGGDDGGEGGSGASGADGGGGTSNGSGDGGAGNEGSGGDGGSVNYFNSTPEDWRSQALSNMGLEEGTEDYDKRMKQMERYTDFSAFTKSGFEAQDRIRKGEISNGLPENATDEQMQQYREANGIPESADGYELALDEGLVLGEDDNRIMGDVFKAAHAANVPTETINALTNAMLKGRQAEAEAQVAQDGVDTQTTNRQLKETWGADFQTNVNMVKGLVNQLPESVRDLFGSARLPDGKAVFNSPEMMVAMADWARTINPSATVVPNSSNPVASMNDEIKALEARMGDGDWHSDKDAQKRYMDLITARDSMEKQG